MKLTINGAGLRVAADSIERKSSLDLLATVLTVAVPVAVFIGLIYVLYHYLVRRFASFQAWLLLATASIIAVSVFAALSGVSISRCLVVLMFAPTMTVVAYEVLGYRYQAEALGA